MKLAKLTIVILMLAALLFAVAPNLSWGVVLAGRGSQEFLAADWLGARPATSWAHNSLP